MEGDDHYDGLILVRFINVGFCPVVSLWFPFRHLHMVARSLCGSVW